MTKKGFSLTMNQIILVVIVLVVLVISLYFVGFVSETGGSLIDQALKLLGFKV